MTCFGFMKTSSGEMEMGMRNNSDFSDFFVEVSLDERGSRVVFLRAEEVGEQRHFSGFSGAGSDD